MADRRPRTPSRARAPRSSADISARIRSCGVYRIATGIVLSAAFSGCSHDEPEAPPGAPVRLVDILDRAILERPDEVAPRELECTRLASSVFESGTSLRKIVGPAAVRLVSLRLGEEVDPPGATADGDGEVATVDDRDRPCTELRRNALVAWVCPIAEGLPIEAVLTTRGEILVAPEFIELEHAPPSGELLSQEDIVAAIDEASALTRAAFRPVGVSNAPGPDGAVEWSAVIAPRVSTRALLFWATSVGAKGALRLTELRLRRAAPDRYLDPIDSTVPTAPSDIDNSLEGRALRVPIDGTERESIVLDAPGSMRMTLRLPAEATTLRFALGVLQGAPDATCSVRVAAQLTDGAVEDDRPPVERVVGPIGTRPPRWELADLDLRSLAGRAIELRFHVDRAGSEGPFPVAIGSPVIELGERRAVRSAAPVGDRWDLVLISLDTLRRDRLEPYGYARPTTPRLRELAEESWVFENAISPSSWTLPAHASLFTGRAPQGHQVIEPDDRVVAGRSTLLAQCFRAAGYETVAFTGSGFLNPRFGMSTGFERYGYSDPVRYRLDPEGAVELLSHPPRRELVELLRTPPRRPRFVFVHTYAAHDYVATPDDLRAIGSSEAEARSSPLTLRMRKASGLQQALAQEGSEGRIAINMRNLYDASVRAADRLVGEVMDALRESGRLEETLVIVCSDHGEDLLERGHLGHGTDLGERQIRIPLIIRVPGKSPRRVVDLVSLVDLAPTVAELCGVLPPEVTDGRSLAPLFSNGALPPRGVLLGLHDTEGLRTLRLKLVEGSGRISLYDIANDLLEDDDISARTEEISVLHGELEAARAAARRAPGARRHEETHADVEAELRELGYLGGR